MKIMLSLQLLGRLGNHLYILSSAYSLKKKFKCDVKIILLDPKLTGYDKWCYDSYFLNVQKYFEFVITDNVVPNFTDPYEYIEYEMNDNLYISSFFQNIDYFKDDFDEIKNDLFKFEENIFNKNKMYLDNLKNDDKICAVVVRRGDYLLPNHKNFNICGKDFYEKSMSISKNKKFLFFSDDINWCKENFSHIKNTFFVEENLYGYDSDLGRKYAIESLIKISLCDSIISSNTTFGLWGYYLGKQKEEMIFPNKTNLYKYTKDTNLFLRENYKLIDSMIL